MKQMWGARPFTHRWNGCPARAGNDFVGEGSALPFVIRNECTGSPESPATRTAPWHAGPSNIGPLPWGEGAGGTTAGEGVSGGPGVIPASGSRGGCDHEQSNLVQTLEMDLRAGFGGGMAGRSSD